MDLDKIFQCSKCEKNLKMDSMTLTCLHSLCGQCFEDEFLGRKSGNSHCPECQEFVKPNQLSLSPFLVNSLKYRQRYGSTEWKCDVCLEKGEESIAEIWCKDCYQLICGNCEKSLENINHNPIKLDEKVQDGKCNDCLEKGKFSLAKVSCKDCNKLFCDDCDWYHKTYLTNHNSVVLRRKDQVEQSIRTDLCNEHEKVEECYCERCNMCFCNTCYDTHLNESPQCPSHPISVREEAVKKRKSQGPAYLKEIEELKNNLQERNRLTQFYCEQLEMDCEKKCNEIWQNFEDILEELRNKTRGICDELRSLKNNQVKKWGDLMEENQRMLKKLEIWCLHLCYFLGKNEKDKNEMICGVKLVANKLASLTSQLHLIEPIRKRNLSLNYSDFWQKFLEGLKNEKIASGYLNYSGNLIKFETEWNLPESNTYRRIHSIVVSQKDCHIFVVDYVNKSIIEFTELGEFICECFLIDGGKKFAPAEMFLTSSEILGVNCSIWWGEEKIFLLIRNNCPPFLKIEKIIEKKKNFPFSFSVCKINKKILICDEKKFQIDFYTENGEYIKTIDTGESGGVDSWGNDYPLIRADPLTGKFWGAIPGTCKMFCFDKNGQKLKSFETEEKICDFSINEFGNLYFFNQEGIFSFFPEKKLHKFQKESEYFPKVFLSNETFFVFLEIDGNILIKIFKILD